MLAFEQPGPDDISSYFCTGGTTGSPKIAKRTHFSEVFDAWAVTRSVFGDLAPGTTILCGLPLFHVNAQIVTGLIPWSSAGHVVLASPQGYRGAGIIDRFWAIAEHYAINAFSGVPTVYSALLRQPSEGFEISSIDWAFCGAAPMPVELFQRFVEQTGINILEGYGLTEGACVSSINPPRAKPRVGSIGVRLPYQEMLALILDADGNYLRDAETDEVGVIAINGPNVFAGYVDDAHTQSVWLQRGGERWLNTGDLGRQDADGYFWITGRRKELIIRGGHNIDPQTIEEPAHRHPAVALAAAVGRPDSHAGEVPVLYAELRAGAEVSEAELMAHCEATISERAARPRFVRIVDALPVTAIGKIHKPTLVCREIEDVIRCHARDVTADLIAIEARIDPNYGQVADVRMKGGEGPLREATSGYAFKVRFVNEFQGTQAS
jgi:fatty-acyl-CoA synthase